MGFKHEENRGPGVARKGMITSTITFYFCYLNSAEFAVSCDLLKLKTTRDCIYVYFSEVISPKLGVLSD